MTIELIRVMIVGVNRMGGLGNQLFQYAAARAVAKHYRIGHIVLESEIDNIHNIRDKDYAAILYDDTTDDQELLKECGYYFQEGFSTPWDVRDASPPVVLRGYFQFLPAIESVLPDIREMLLKSLSQYRKEIKMKYSVEEDRSVFVHVRRGDYVSKSDYHYVQSMDYYKTAHRRLPPDVKIYILSDDPAWVMEQDWGFEYILVDEEDEILALAFMSLCRAGAIIANSSFSWWGAIIADPECVFYPKKWINAHIYDLFPSSWQSI